MRDRLYDVDNNDAYKLRSSVAIPSTLEAKPVNENAENVLNLRYYMTLNGKKETTFSELCSRVAHVIASGEAQYGYDSDRMNTIAKSIYNDMMSHRFLFNSPALFSAGVKMDKYESLLHETNFDLNDDDWNAIAKNQDSNQMLFACFVIPIEDSIEGIFNSVKSAAIISKYGGGVGANFSRLREKGSPIAQGAGGKSSGPVLFMETWNTMGNVVVQGGKRRAALMGMLNIDHPDIEEFITAKTENGKLSYFNISVAINNKFMEAVKSNSDFDLVSPLDGKVIKTVNARELWDFICTNAHKRGDPGVFFIDLAQDDSMLKWNMNYVIESTNPCFTGDTLVAVADGRGNVSFKELAEQGKDVQVYTTDADGNVVVRYMRNPRKTGNTKTYKVVFSNGKYIKCTSNHKFYTSHVTYKTADKLAKGDKLCIVIKDRYAYSDSEIGTRIGWKFSSKNNDNIISSYANSIIDSDYIVRTASDDILIKTCKYCGSAFVASSTSIDSEFCCEECALNYSPEQSLNRYDAIVNEYVVERVEYCGVEDVYNGTVDEYHSYLVGAYREIDDAGATTTVYIKSANCGEQPLVINESNSGGSSCNLGSINVYEFVEKDFNGKYFFNYDKFIAQIHRAMYYLDLVIDVTSYPLKNIEENTKDIRPVGLGIMGLADAAILLGYTYGDDDFLEWCDNIGKALAKHSLLSSIFMADLKGSYPVAKTFVDRLYTEPVENLPRSFVSAITTNEDDGEYDVNIIDMMVMSGIRNSRRLTIAPTGTISLLLNTSSSIEPNFAFEWYRDVITENNEKIKLKYTHRLNTPENAKAGLLLTAHDIDVDMHIEPVAVFAKYVDAAISKTVNLPETATVDDVKYVYEKCYEKGIKGITIYRNNSRDAQPLHANDKKTESASTPSIQSENVMIKDRPKFVRGITTKSDSPWGSMYVTLNFDNNNKCFEVFVTAGKSGSENKAVTEALSRVISLALRAGISLDEIIRTISNISGSEVWVYEAADKTEVYVKSIPDAIAKMLHDLKEYKDSLTYQISASKTDSANNDNVISHKTDTCPECGGKLDMVSGCNICKNCGWSACR